MKYKNGGRREVEDRGNVSLIPLRDKHHCGPT